MPRLSFLVRFIAIGILLHAYVGFRLIPDLPVPAAVKWLAVLWLVLSVLVIPPGMLARRFKRQPLGDRLAWTGMLFMGFFSSLLMLTIMRDLVLASLMTVAAIWPHAADLARWRTGSAAAVVVLAFASTAFGFFNARRRARVRNVDVPIRNLPAELDGFTIVQLSDIHVGPTIKHDYVERIVRAVNQLDADVVAITGDVVDGSVQHLADHTAPLGRLAAQHGVYLVTGNHEYYSGADAWVAEFRRIGLTVLMNQHVVIEHGGARLVLAGVTDYTGGHFDPAHR
ncbi:MAG: metallophosphoesterase, partial [Paraburkholderia tropica]